MSNLTDPGLPYPDSSGRQILRARSSVLESEHAGAAQSGMSGLTGPSLPHPRSDIIQIPIAKMDVMLSMFFVVFATLS